MVKQRRRDAKQQVKSTVLNAPSTEKRKGFNWRPLSILLLFLAVFWAYGHKSFSYGSGITPFKMGGIYEHAMLWGTYRPGFYFGIRSRTFPQYVSAGLMWTNLETENRFKMRHECRENDELKSYGWVHHTGRNYGKQLIQDDLHGALLSTSFYRMDNGFPDSQSSWRVVVENTDTSDAKINGTVDAFFYLFLDCYIPTRHTDCGTSRGALLSASVKSTGEIKLDGVLGDHGSNFRISVGTSKGSSAPSFYTSIEHNLADMESTIMNERLRLGRNGILEFKFDNVLKRESALVVFHARVRGGEFLEVNFQTEKAEDNSATNTALSMDLALQFEARFESTFLLSQKNLHDVPFNISEIKFAQAALSNLLGGIGYFYGQHAIETNKGQVKYSKPISLYTAVPSRSFFPRGFLWDEGFHLLLVLRWDREIAKDIISHWFSSMDEATGWIPREQILGSEAVRRVPREFLKQNAEHANPPTIILAVESLLGSDAKIDDGDKQFLISMFPYLQKWYNWFVTNQVGATKDTFRWRGRSSLDGKLNANTLASGFDDYPRASEPSNREIHVDLLCWMIRFAKAMHRISNVVETNKTIAQRYKLDEQKWRNSLDKNHWDTSANAYLDKGMHSATGEYKNLIVVKCQSATTNSMIESLASLEDLQSRINPCPKDFPRFLYPLGDGNGGLLTRPVFYPTNVKYQFVHHIGYVSLMPFLLQIVSPSSSHLEHILGQLTDPKQLWTNFGIRSISAKDPLYGMSNADGDRPYWRGAIWMNMNYLISVALRHYGNLEGPYQDSCREAYARLRQNLIKNVYKEYAQSGYIWEQYSDLEGKGSRSHPFTGWSALIVNLMAEQY